MTSEGILKIWSQIEALPELKAKLALFGLVMQDLGRKGEKWDEDELKKILESAQRLDKIA